MYASLVPEPSASRGVSPSTRGSTSSGQCALLWELAERQASDDLMGWAGELVADEPIVRRRRTLVTAILDELLDLARAQGRLRADASSRDIHLLFAATRGARAVDADGWRRVLVLLIDSLRDQ